MTTDPFTDEDVRKAYQAWWADRGDSHTAIKAALLAGTERLLATIADLRGEVERLKAVETERDELRVSIVDLDRVVDQLDIANTTCDPAEMIAELQSLNATLSERARVLEAALHTAIKVVQKAHKEWDADNDPRVGKLLMALAGYVKGYRADIDGIHAALTPSKEA